MLKSRMILLSGCLFFGITLVSLLYFNSERLTLRSNGFLRKLPSHKVFGLRYLNLKGNSWYIAGFNNGLLYLGNKTAPNQLMKINTSLNASSVVTIPGPPTMKVYKGAMIQIDSPYIFLKDGIKPMVVSGSISDLTLRNIAKTPYYTACTALSPTTFIFRSVVNLTSNVLIKQNDDQTIKEDTSILRKEINGVFSTDGVMLNVSQSSKFVYVNYYSNQFICADTNLNLLYRANTIDTVRKAQIKVARIAPHHQLTLASPPLQVNATGCATKDWLLIKSLLRADNETKAVSKHNTIIDVYALQDGKYKFSFYLPDFQGEKVREFKVGDKILYALYDHFIYSYRLNF